MVSNSNKVSVIVSVLNGEKTIERCIKSVLKQDYKDVELIIIDGESKDNTVGIIKAYSDYISYWISEKDTGIYNAWNKAVSKAKGEWICFIGSDDVMLPNSLSLLLEKAQYPDVNFVSSRVMMVNEQGEEFGSIGKSWSFQKLKEGLGVVHCGALHHRTLFVQHGTFDETYKIAGDFEFLMRAGKSIKSSFLNEVTVKMCNTGISRRSVNKVVFETSKVLFLNSNFGRLHGAKYFISAHLRSFVREFVFLFPFGKRWFSLRNRQYK